ncbi:MAG: quinone-dependent dihydroorotate dehydrogenase [Gammaproteobacteria bacterium]|nr:quinone-dependent dihydroorotate dehydrogenase [Gammaproteobacteria bacterium]
MFYPLLRSALFTLEAEKAHDMTLKGLDRLLKQGLLARFMKSRVPHSPRSAMGLTFCNPVGLAAGLDKNGEYINALSNLGFGFLEVGTVTPRPQAGNEKPRLFRLAHQQAIINRMGFNNKGVDYLLDQVEKAQFRGVLGINIGKNFDTPVANATDDYLYCLRKVYHKADYITVNISSPNTPDLRSLQLGGALVELLQSLKAERKALQHAYGHYVPMAVKIAPDLSPNEIKAIAISLMEHGIDAVIATNTTSGREGIEHNKHAKQMGGLSGRPLMKKSTQVVRELAKHLEGTLPIIAAGGISSGADAREKIDAGATLIQVYSGLIYQGPGLIRNIARALEDYPPR